MKKDDVNVGLFYINLQKDEEWRDFSLKNPTDFRRIIRYRHLLFQNFQEAFQKRDIGKLKWDRYISTQREIDTLVNFIIGDVKNEPCFVAFGGANMPNFICGYQETPLKLIQKRIFDRAKEIPGGKLKVVTVDEHCTTKMCSNCVNPMLISKSPHRFAYCKHCKTTWERDTNGGRNILNIALILEGLLNKSAIKNPNNFRALRRAQENVDEVIFLIPLINSNFSKTHFINYPLFISDGRRRFLTLKVFISNALPVWHTLLKVRNYS